MSAYCFLYIYSTLSLFNDLDIWIYTFHQIWKELQVLLLNYLFFSLSFLGLHLLDYSILSNGFIASVHFFLLSLEH